MENVGICSSIALTAKTSNGSFLVIGQLMFQSNIKVSDSKVMIWLNGLPSNLRFQDATTNLTFLRGDTVRHTP